MIHFNKNEDGIAILSFNQPNSAVNVINEATMSGFEKLLNEIIADTGIKGVILTSSKKDFMVGADLNMIVGVNSAREIMDAANRLHTIMRKMETGGKPFVAAINGTALGGGFEFCLACHYRIAINNPKIQIGLPEVLLGLLPGGGGTQRLPRLIGIQNAMRPLLEGQKLRPEEAKSLGMIDELVNSPEELISAAKKWILEKGNNVQLWDSGNFKIPGGDVKHPNSTMVFAGTAGLIRKKTYGNYPAPFEILACVFEGLQLPFDKALKLEARHFAKCVMSDVSKNMIRTLFFHLNDANKGIARPKGYDKNLIEKVGILGAGMMGAGIAYVSAVNGINVILKDISVEAAEKGKDYSRKLLSERIAKGRMTKEKMEEILNRIHTTDSSESLSGCNLVIEAVFEDRELKAKVTQETEAAIQNNFVFASNTSTLPITGLAEASSKPKNFIGLHFFSPVEKMPLVEIIMGKKTSDFALALCIDYVMAIKKTPIVVNDSRGFFTSRVFSTYLFEGFEMLAEGIRPALIENAGKMAGMPVGPLAVADEVSIELAYKINKQTEKDTGKKDDSKAVEVINRFVEEFNRLGKKAGKGFYEYPADSKKYLWPQLSEYFPPLEKQPDVEELKKRFLYRQAIETARCLEEKVLRTPQDGDIGSIMGIGFPPYTGGAISFIEWVGTENFIKECNRLKKLYGTRFAAPKSIKKMNKENKSYFSVIS
jgi:3-hydroxyacyl-CoA dehydrogenase / enoyl-CoA hydratase / 3-hydroxybutyryl-CoA epimerase